MKFIRIAIAAGLLGSLAAPAAAQLESDSVKFVEAVNKRDGGAAKQLLAENPRLINSKSDKGDTALLVAIRSSDSPWTAFLLSKGADPNLQGIAGDTPLIAAARLGFDQGVEWLLDLGAKVDGTNRAGETPLIVAVQQRATKTVKLLLAAGADPDRTDSVAGYSARDYAMRDSRSRDIQKLINDKKSKPAN